MQQTDPAPLGLVLSTVTDAPVEELVDIGQRAEAAGFSSVHVNEGRGDALACVEAIGLATSTIGLGTNIANIYFRHPFLAANAARTIGELTNGRLVLGLGMSHRGMLRQLGIDMGDAREHLASYVETVVSLLRGEGVDGFLKPPPSRVAVPVYVAGNTVESASVAGRHGNGLMPYLSPLGYLPTLLDAARIEARARGVDEFGCILSIPTFLSDDRDAARSAARYNLAFFSQLPNYRRQWRRGGFGDAMDRLREHWRRGGSRGEAAALALLLSTNEAARQLNSTASGVLIFPNVVRGGAIAGGTRGQGVLRQGGRTTGYYVITSVSYGLQFGVTRFGYVMFFQDAASLAFLDESGGWEVGVGPNVTVADEGFASRLSTTTAQEGIVVFFVEQAGFFAGGALEGTNISRAEGPGS